MEEMEEKEEEDIVIVTKNQQSHPGNEELQFEMALTPHHTELRSLRF
jgi:hypothetical protein